jgi:hypothetical protein
MAHRIIPGAVSSTSLRALVLCDEPLQPALALTDVRGAACPPLRLRPHGSGDPRFDQHVLGAGVRLYVAEATGLKPAADYQIGKTHVRTLPRQLPAAGLRIALASCYCDDFKRDADYLRVLQGAAGYNPLAAKLLVGDNVYIDVGAAEADARTPFESTAERYLRHYWRGGYADVLSYLPTFTMWDDHEFWNNYPEKQIWLARSMGRAREDYRDAALAGIRAFQAVLNPTPAARKGLSYKFDLAGLAVFALDLRAGRSPHDAPDPIMCSEPELQAFERWAAGLKGPGALVLGQPLWIGSGDWQDWNPPSFVAQYARIWKALGDAPFDIVVLSGDVHHSRLLEIEVCPGRRVWELVSSPVCHIPTIESIAARAFDVQGVGSVGFPLAVPVRGMSPRLVGYHMGTGLANTLALLRLTRVADGIAFAGSFVDLVRKTAAPGSPPPAGCPVAPGDHAWCQRDPMFVLRRRTP